MPPFAYETVKAKEVEKIKQLIAGEDEEALEQVLVYEYFGKRICVSLMLRF